MRKVIPWQERFWKFVKKTPGCWIWIGSKYRNGYGRIRPSREGDSDRLAHRCSWELHFGIIPEKMGVLHKCDNRACVRPDHLFLGTQKDNVKDMFEKGRENIARGERHRSAKLTEKDVENIRFLHDNGSYLHSDLARKYGVSTPIITRIVNGKIWQPKEKRWTQAPLI